MAQNIKFQVIGDYKKFGKNISQKIETLVAKTQNFTKITLTFALNYGSKQEITRGINLAINDIIKAHKEKITDLIDKENIITVESFNNYLCTKNMPEPELVIRTGGEKRLSNFLLWQLSYSEFIFYDFMWPEFKAKHIDETIEIYNLRQRRHGS